MNPNNGDENHEKPIVGITNNESVQKKDISYNQFQTKVANRPMVEVVDLNDEDMMKKINNKISTVFQMRKKALAQSKNMPNAKNSIKHQCVKCQCGGTSECTKKINFLQGKLRQMLNTPYKKQVIQVYDIEKMGLENQYYLIQYSDNTMQKVSAKYLKKNYIKSYVQFLQSKCFSQFRH